jgi:AcrR family transcriptional regulator
VLDAARRLLAENGFEGFTVQEVAARSEVSVGAIYDRFGSKESLLRVVHAELMETMADTWPARRSRGGEETAFDAVAAAVDLVARNFAAHRDTLRPFMHLGAIDSVIAERGSRASIKEGSHFKAMILVHRAEILHANPDLAVDIAFRMVYCTLARQTMYGPQFESERRVSWKQLVSELTGACAAYLLHHTAGGQTPAAVRGKRVAPVKS